MTRAGPLPRDGARARRLRVLTRLTVLAWVTALGLAIVPVVVGAAGAGAPSSSPGLDARPEKTSAARATKPKPTAKPHPTRRPQATATPQATPTPQATRRPQPTPGAKASATPRPDQGNAGSQGKPQASSKPGQGGVEPGTNGNGGNSGNTGNQATTGGSQDQGGSSGAGPAASAAAPFSVPGLGPVARSNGQPADGSESLFSGALYLDFDLASSIDLLTPAALLALPGLLIIVSLVAQIAGGVLWIPITRRLLGDPSTQAGEPRIRRR